MAGRLWRWLLERLRGLWAWWQRLGRGPKAALLSLALVLATTAAVGGYKVYNYIEHDNVFCSSCHSMSDPYERFGRSAHSKIECHDCHKASIIERTSMLVKQVIHQPVMVSSSIHAHVPNEVCTACHVNGDSTRWKQVQSSAGHRAHLLSQDSALRGLQCVVCHGGTDLHSFASVDQTCGKSGCHTSNKVTLGKMGNLSIYCATCHGFMVGTTAIGIDSLGRALTPQATQCLSCHEMRQRFGTMEVADDPHGGVCGNCHNPHTQRTASDAATSCAKAGCHVPASIDTVRFHRGVHIQGRCTTCHRPHAFRVDGNDCLRCHANIRNERPSAALGPRPQGTEEVAASGAHRDILQVSTFYGASPPQQPAARTAPPGTLPRFSHGDHRNERCTACHDSREQHGKLKVRSAADCRNCHHAGEARNNCVSCHSPVRTVLNKDASINRPGRQPVTRSLRFAHARHTTLRCDQCHASSTDRTVSVTCASCHDAHHGPTANCLGCHAAANALASHRVADHASCSSAGCHAARLGQLPDTRATCLVCHQQQAAHQPGKNCSICHQVRAA